MSVLVLVKTSNSVTMPEVLLSASESAGKDVQSSLLPKFVRPPLRALYRSAFCFGVASTIDPSVSTT